MVSNETNASANNRIHRQSGSIRGSFMGNWKTAHLAQIRNFRLISTILILLTLLFVGCAPRESPTPQLATIIAAFDMGGGGAGFAATIYAQEVGSGKTFHSFYPAGSHGGVVLPTSPPIVFTVEAPGTYVFYARLINEPDSYHFGATGCLVATDCPTSDLLAVDVEPGGTYNVYIGDRSAQIPIEDKPVTVPWHR